MVRRPLRPVSDAFLLVVIALLAGGATPGAPQARPDGPDRAKLLQLRREAADRVEKAGRSDVSPEDALRARQEAAERLSVLGREPEAAGAGSPLASELRAELRRAAQDLAAPPASGSRFDAAPYLALLERVRVKLEGEIALGLSLQGSYSQTKVKEPVYGGHASAMGPAPVPMADDSSSEPSPALFEEAGGLTAKTYCGGPTKDHILESGGSGVALFDYDGDGRLDVYLVTAAELTKSRERVPHRNVLYRNLGGLKFEDVSKKAGLDAAAWGNGVCAGDYDGDGALDLYVTNWGGNFLFRNQGDGTFKDVAAAAGVAASGWSTGCTFFDADADGDLDLYVARYVKTSWDEVVSAQRTLVWRNGPHIMVGPAGLPGEEDLFFLNRGDGTFVEASAAAGLADPAKAYGFGVVATDYDGDGRVDLFVANDSNPNFLYRNTIYRNVDGGGFEDASGAAGIATSTFARMGWGTAFIDADLDGRLDLVVANGHIFSDVDRFPALGETYAQTSQLLLNQGGTFRDVSAGTGGGLQTPRVSRGLAVGDLDDDGDPDVVLSNMDAPPALLENRQRTGRHWIAFRLSAPAGNRLAIGATVTVTSGGKAQTREVRSGGSYLSQSDLRPLFGLGDAAGPVSVEVRMPGGVRWSWQDLPVDRLHTLELTGTGRR